MIGGFELVKSLSMAFYVMKVSDMVFQQILSNLWAGGFSAMC